MRLHLKNKATHWEGDGDLKLVWCVVSEAGEHLTGWLSFAGAEQQLGKMLAYARRGFRD